MVAVPQTADEPMTVEAEPPEEEESYCDVACREDGLCAIADGSCTALENGHCAPSRACQDEGRCVAREGACVKAAEGNIAACRQLVSLMRRCLPTLGGANTSALEQAISKLEATYASIQDPEQRKVIAETCESTLKTIAQNPQCQGPP